MTWPLFLLAGFSVFAGYVGLPAILGERADVFGRYLEAVFRSPARAPSASLEWSLIGLSVAAALLGLGLAYLFYLKTPTLPGRLSARFPGLYRLLAGKYFVDEIYDAAVVRPAVRGAALIYARFDLPVVDGLLNGSAAATDMAGRGLGRLQSGFLKDYALAFLLGAMLFLGFLLVSP